MASPVHIEQRISPEGVIVLEVSADRDTFFDVDASKRLKEELAKRYQDLYETAKDRLKTASCVVVLKSPDTGTSPVFSTAMGHAVYNLLGEVINKKREGKVVVTPFPMQFIDTWTGLGYHKISALKMATSEGQAIDLVKPKTP
jgi:hypothetical protein